MSRYNNDDGTIKWQKSDEIRLQKAINNFNSKRNRLMQKEKQLESENRIITNTIDKESYKDMKSKILTREGLNDYIKSLRDFSKRGAEEIDKKHEKETGQQISKWQKKQITKYINVAKPRLEKQLEDYKKEVEGSGGLSKLDMRNTTALHLQNEIDTLENYKNKTGYSFRKKVKGLKHLGAIDYDLWLDINYKEQYIKVMEEKYKNMPYYEKFIAHLMSIPATQFYDTIKPKTEHDYAGEDGSDLYRQSNETLTVSEFVALLKRWNVPINTQKVDYQEEVQKL